MKKLIITLGILLTLAVSVPVASSNTGKCHVDANGKTVCVPPPVPRCTPLGCP